MTKFDMIEAIAVTGILFFVILLCLYHVSFDGYLGLKESTWNVVWAVSENGLALFLCALTAYFTSGIVREIVIGILMPYFVLKIIYLTSCYSDWYLFSPASWQDIWSYFLVVFFILTLLYHLILRKYVA